MAKQKILVTGGLGFIGSHPVVELQQAGYEVVILDDLSNSDIQVLERIEKITSIKPVFYQVNMLDKKNLEYRDIKFGDKGDYEDIVKVQDTIYMLIATGGILKVTGYKDDSTIQSSVIATVPGKSNEFESMYYDKDVHSLIMLCKTCHKEKDQIRTAFRFDLATNINLRGRIGPDNHHG